MSRYQGTLLPSGLEDKKIETETRKSVLDLLKKINEIYSELFPVSGSNTMGDYIKFPDGTMECRFMDTVSVTTNQATGGIFRSTPDSPYTFPVPFVGRLPIVVPIGQSTSGLIWGVLSAVSTTTPVSLTGVLLRAEGSSVAGTGTLGYVAYGYWK